MGITIKDVAREANVSIGTVSRVLNNKMHVAPSTYSRIMAAVEKLHYVPNTSAIRLVKQSNMTVLCADSYYKNRAYDNPHMFDIISGITYELKKKNYTLSLLDLGKKQEEAESAILHAISSNSSDGIILNQFFMTPKIERALLEHDFPHICLGKPNFDSMISWIDTNHALSSNLAVKHLLDTGCKRIAFIGGPEDDGIYKERLRGYLRSLEHNNLTYHPEYDVCTSSNTQSIAEATQKLLSLPEPPDSILCFNGLFAVIAIQVINNMKLRIPQDISVMAFDNYPYAPLVIPPLSVVDIDMFDLGQKAAKALLKKLDNSELYIQTYTALPHLIIRESTSKRN